VELSSTHTDADRWPWARWSTAINVDPNRQPGPSGPLILNLFYTPRVCREPGLVQGHFKMIFLKLKNCLIFAYLHVFILSLTLVATAIFIHVVSRPQVALNLAAQVTCDLAVRRRTPSLPPPPQLSQGPRHGLYCCGTFQYCFCCLPSWQLNI
jgi:hypothetical protein